MTLIRQVLLAVEAGEDPDKIESYDSETFHRCFKRHTRKFIGGRITWDLNHLEGSVVSGRMLKA